MRWRPGCGDYVILNTVQSFLPSLGIAREDMVIVSEIGCSSRLHARAQHTPDLDTLLAGTEGWTVPA